MDKYKTKIEEEQSNEAVSVVEYSEKEKDYRKYLIKRLKSAEIQRDASHIEFDDMNFLTWHEKNKKAANAYIPPKKNKGDTRIVTGTTQEKGVTLLSALLNYNLEPNIEAFDRQDIPIRELGENMEDMVKKSRKIEEYDDKRLLIYKELLDQGTCFVEEQWVEQIGVEKDFKDLDWSEGTEVKDIDWKVKLKAIEGKCEVNLLSSAKVYLGNVKQFHIAKQPFIFTHDIIPYEEAKTIYRNWDRWQYVTKDIKKFNIDNDNTDYEDWTLQEVNENMVEIIKYQDKWNNEFMIMINGVMMLPIEFPLIAISPSGEYTLIKGVAEPMSDFFVYGKSIPSKSKADQEVLDEMLKMIILKTQQSFKPPLANLSNKILAKDIFLAGTITSDVNPDMLKPIIDARGVTPAEFNATQFIKEIIDSKTVSPSFMGEQTKGNQTATEIMELKKQQMMKLGLLIFGVVSMEKQLSWLRIQNILANWTKPIDTGVDDIKKELQDIYRTVSVETNLDSGQTGQKIIKFNQGISNQITPDQVRAEEDFLSEPGKPVRVVYFNPEMLANIKATWFIDIIPTEKSSGELDAVLYQKGLMDAVALFGVEALNWEYHKVRWAVLRKEDPNKYFIKNAPPPSMEEEGKQGVKTAPAEPTLNQLMK